MRNRFGLVLGNVHLAYLPLLARLFMLDEIQAVALLCLIGCHYFLIRGCFGIREELPIQGGHISDKIERTGDLLDEVAQLISDFSEKLGSKPNVQPPSSPMEAIFTSLISKMTMPSEHGRPQKDEWEILPKDNDPPNPTQTENEPHELGS